MGNLAIVALPARDDYVYKISSEQIPHMTLLFLGDSEKVANFGEILNFVSHATQRSLESFGLEVDRRGILGPDQADVLFFSKTKWSGFEAIRDYRSYLLKDDNIRKAYDSTEQFPKWIPHLTLGHPDAPAKPDERDYPGITHIQFDRIAVWFNAFEGVELTLKSPDWDMGMNMDVMMGNTTAEIVENILSHHGIKGMRWGVRNTGQTAIGNVRSRRRLAKRPEVTVRDKGKKLKTSGGRGNPAHPDAIRARTLGQVGKKSGVKALSDKELQDYTKRLQLEQSVKRLQYNEKPAAKRFVAKILGQSGNSIASEGVNKGAKEVGKKALTLALVS